MASSLTSAPRRSIPAGTECNDHRSTSTSRSVAVSNLAGQSPHVRVQYEQGGEWHRYATFREAESAMHCAQQLMNAGYRVRLVSFSIAPAAG